MFQGEGLNKESKDLELDACSWELKAAELNNTGQHETPYCNMDSWAWLSCS
jgi:hypothetical protein